MAPGRKRGTKAAAAARQIWNVGDLVLAKVKGFPAWPAQVSEPENWGGTKDHRKVFVFFFGTEQIAFVHPGDIQLFTPETKKKLLAKAQGKSATTDFCRAVTEICHADDGSSDLSDEDSLDVAEEFSEMRSDERSEFCAKDDSKKEGAASLVSSRGRMDSGVQEELFAGFKQIHPKSSDVGAINGCEGKLVPHTKHGGTCVMKINGGVDGGVASGPSKVLERTVVDYLASDTKGFPVTTQKTRPCLRPAGESLGVHSEQGDVASSFISLPIFMDADTRGLTIEEQAPDRQEQTNQAKECTTDMEIRREVGGLANDYTSFSLVQHPKLTKDSVDSLNVNNLKGLSHEVSQARPLNRQISERDDSQDGDTVENVPMRIASYEELWAATPLDSGDDKQEGAEYLQQALLPRKKRRVLRKPETDINGFENAVQEPVPSPPHQVQGDTQDRPIVAEYRRRKRDRTLMHSQAKQTIQVVDSDNNQANAAEKKSNLQLSLNLDVSDCSGKLSVLEQPLSLKRQRTSDAEQSPKACMEIEEAEEHSLLKASAASDDDHLPLCKSFGARLGKGWRLQLPKEKRSVTLATENQVEEPASTEDSVEYVHISENAVCAIEASLSLVQPVSNSRLLVDRDTSLPPKADDYGRRTGRGTGEAPHLPSNIRKCALEVRTECAEAGGECQSIDKLKRQHDSHDVTQVKRLFTEKDGPCDGKPNETEVNSEKSSLAEELSSKNATSKSDEFGTIQDMQTCFGKVTSTQLEEAKIKECEDATCAGHHVTDMPDNSKAQKEVDGLIRSANDNNDSHMTVAKLEIEKCMLKLANLSQTKQDGSRDALSIERPNRRSSFKFRKLGLKPSKETVGPKQHIASGANIGGEKPVHEVDSKQQEHYSKQGVLDHSEVSCLSRILPESPSESHKFATKSGTMELTNRNNANGRVQRDAVGFPRPQSEANANAVRAAVEAAKEVKQRRQAQLAASVRTFSNVSVAEKYPSGLASSPSPVGSSLQTSPPQLSPANPIQDPQRMLSADGVAPVSVLDTFRVARDETGISHCQQASSSKGFVVGHMEAAVARDALEGMLETLTRTRESIARATRHALDCANYGIGNQVVEIIVQRLENEPSFHRRVDLFFLVDSITQCSWNLKGVAGAVYPLAVQGALPRLLNAAVPPGSVAQENRQQCLKVLKLWSKRNVMPEFVLRRYINDLEACYDDKTIGTFPHRPSRLERAVDDPIREMEGMHVDEYGSNASFTLPGLLIFRMLKDDEDSCGVMEELERDFPSHCEDKEESSLVSPMAGEKHPHILEEVEGELEMEDVFPEDRTRKDQFGESMCADSLGILALQRESQILQLPSEPPPPPPDSPPPSPPPLPKSPPPPSSPPPPPPHSPPPPSSPPCPFPKSHPPPYMHSCGHSFLGFHAVQLSPAIPQSGSDTSYCVPSTRVHRVSGSYANEKRYEQYGQHNSAMKRTMPKPSHPMKDPAYTTTSSITFTQNSQPFSVSTPPSRNALYVQTDQHRTGFSQSQFRHLPSRPPPPKRYAYRNSESSHIVSSPSFGKRQHPAYINHVQSKQRHPVHGTLGRRRFDGMQCGRKGQIQSLTTGFMTVNGSDAGLQTSRVHDHRPRLSNGNVRSVSGSLHACGPGTVIGTPVMPNTPYACHEAMTGGLMHDTAQVQMLGCHLGGPTSKGVPS